MPQNSSDNFLASSLTSELQKYRYLTEKEVAALTGRALQTLRNDRFRGRGFPYVKLGASVRYPLASVLSAMESRRIDVEAL